MITIYLIRGQYILDHISEDKRQQMLSLLCVDRKNKAEKIKVKHKQDMSILTGYALQQVIKKYVAKWGYHVDTFQFETGKCGKPCLTKNWFEQYQISNPVEFNLSHSGDEIAIGIGETELGIDIQKVQNVKADEIAKRFFSETESERLKQLEGNEKVRAFFEIWVQKEAFAKYSGEGLAHIFSERTEFENMRDIYIESFSALKNICGAICINKKKRVKIMDFTEELFKIIMSI